LRQRPIASAAGGKASGASVDVDEALIGRRSRDGKSAETGSTDGVEGRFGDSTRCWIGRCVAKNDSASAIRIDVATMREAMREFTIQ
jgi:hypothetical protein